MMRIKCSIKYFIKSSFLLILFFSILLIFSTINIYAAGNNEGPGKGILLHGEYEGQAPASLGELARRVNKKMPQLLQMHETAGVAVMYIENNKIIWKHSRGYGYADVATRRPVVVKVDEDENRKNLTLFQAGSLTKLVSAWGALQLSIDYGIDLNEAIDPVDPLTGKVLKNKGYLRSWHLVEAYKPLILSWESFYSWVNKVNLHYLISHGAGLNVPSFQGLVTDLTLDDPESTIPGTIEALRGYLYTMPAPKPWGMSYSLGFIHEPGNFRYYPSRYSGGGYTVIQLLIEDITGVPFAQYMADEILYNDEDSRGLNMENSTYLYDTEFFDENNLDLATSYKYYNPKALVEYVEHPNYLFPEKAAASLYTTPEDFSKFAIKMMQQGEDGKPLIKSIHDPDIKNDFLDNNRGKQIILYDSKLPGSRILFVGSENEYKKFADKNQINNRWKKVTLDGFYGQTGTNFGWANIFICHPENKSGIVIMTNTCSQIHKGGKGVYNEIIDAWLTLQIERGTNK